MFLLNHITGTTVATITRYIGTAIGECIDGKHTIIRAQSAITHGCRHLQGFQAVAIKQCAMLIL